MSQSVCVLTNVSFFDGQWKKCFELERTTRTFHLLGGKCQKTKMMSSEGRHLKFKRFSDWQAMLIPFDATYSMVVALPSDTYNTPLTQLSTDRFEQLLDSKTYTTKPENKLVMPMFETESDTELTSSLIKVGLKNLGPSTGRLRLLSPDLADASVGIDVIQKMKIKVNEKGVQTAAVTSGLMTLSAFTNRDGTELILDSPFLYCIIHNETNEVLTIGQLTDID